MTIYVDNMNSGYGRMKMCHLFADNDEELLEFVDKIGVKRKWHQYPGTIKSHFDICLSKKAKAIELGAIEIDYPNDVADLMRKRKESMK